ncbi:MAG: hypothetical protein ABIO70_29695 [Pseudomonadota bacterium]
MLTALLWASGALTLALDIRESWQAREVPAALGADGSGLLRGARIWPWPGVLELLGAGLAAGPPTRLPIADRGCEPLQLDADPWTVAPARILTISSQRPSLLARALPPYDRLLSEDDEPAVWQDGADWLNGRAP